jgi:dihydroneopterin aldolase
VTALDRVEVLGIRATGHHGVFGFEKEQGQEFVVDVVLHLDTRPAAASDDLADAVDYGVVAGRVHDVVTGEPVDLVEALAARVADACLADLRVRAVDVAVHKPQAPIAVPFDDVVVRIHRAASTDADR